MDSVIITVVVGVAGLLVGYALVIILLSSGKLRRLRYTIESECNREKDLLKQTIDRQNSQLVESNSRMKAFGESISQKEMKILELEKRVSSLSAQLGTIELLKEDKRRMLLENQRLQMQCLQLEKGISEYKTRLSEQERLYTEKMQLLKEAKESLSQEFENLSNKIYHSASEKLTQQNLTSINHILEPLKTQIHEFKQRVENVYDSESKDRRTLYDEIINLKELNIRINEEAANLTNALKGDSQKQGAWGEVVLERLLEESGLRKGHEYETQISFNDEEGRRRRPDVIVHLPDDKDIIIDSKVSLVAYEQYTTASDLSVQEMELKKHITSVRNHVKELYDKSYEHLKGVRSLDYVLMFIPIESAFMTAIEGDRRLFNEAYNKNIILVSPSTLLVTLRTIHNIWRYERQNTNAQEIAERAGKLYDKFVGFLGSMEEIEKYLSKTRNAYESALNKLSRGRGNLIGQSENLRKLGAKTKKRIPLQYDDSKEPE